MPIVRRLQKVGNSRGIILTSDMLDHLGIKDSIQIDLADGVVILRAPAADATLSRIRPGPNRQNHRDALIDTFDQYDGTLRRLSAAPDGNEDSSP